MDPDWKPCIYPSCWHTFPAPFSERLESFIHPDCESAWWEATGPYPKPIVIKARVGEDAMIGKPSPSAPDPESDPEALRKRGVII